MQGKGVPRYEHHIAMMKESVDEFIANHDIVSQFGRDPRRNAILERESTPEEQAYLQQFYSGGIVTHDS